MSASLEPLRATIARRPLLTASLFGLYIATGVIGLAGNVSEWTATTPSRDSAVVRGGSFRDAPAPVAHRPPEIRRTYQGESIGFRCAADVETNAPAAP